MIAFFYFVQILLPFWFWYKCECICWFVWIGCDELIVLIGVCSDCCIFWLTDVWCICWFPVKFKFNGFWFLTHIVFSFCQTNTLWTMAHPQNTIPIPIKTLVIIAGVEWNCVNVYKIIPEEQIKRKLLKCLQIVLIQIIFHLLRILEWKQKNHQLHTLDSR